MNNIEVIICLLMLFMGVPDLCRKLGRPALVYPAFVLFGLVLGSWVTGDVKSMVHEAGKVGFLLLLFEVGLDIDLPRWKEFLRPLRYAMKWSLVQYPLVFGLANVAGLTLGESFLSAAALTGCSVGMAYAGWKQYAGLAAVAKPFVCLVMVALEMLAIVVMAADSAALAYGLHWVVALKLAGIFTAIFLVSQFNAHLTRLFQIILQKTTHWRVHLLVLLVLVICAIGERLGLSAAKTAFFLGLFMSRAEHDGVSLEQFMAPISSRFLIPLFFVALGVQVQWSTLFSMIGMLAVVAGAILLAAREVLHRRWMPTGGDARACLLFCPNLTLVALAATILLEHRPESTGAVWVLLTGLFMSIVSLLMLPATQSKTGEAEPAAATESS
ncbi:MAG TPA: cation:proton antiporter [Verrucomicrobiae bacterium]|nr:cation:proton antiporter [Verrucomicrobiae bacterium]